MQPRRSAPSPAVIFVLLLFLLGAGIWVYWRYFRPDPDIPSELLTAGTESAALSPDAPPPPPAPRPDLPTLDASDAWLRRLLEEAVAHPKLSRWLAPEDLLRRAAAAVDNIARGESPRPHLGSLGPDGSFEVVEGGGGLRPSGDSYRRYDVLVNAFTALDGARLADLYRVLSPLLEEAYADLGYPGEMFGQTLDRAIDRLLAVPQVEAPALTHRVRAYGYADPELESLDAASKHLLRMGPENVRRIQEQLRRFAAALEDR